MVDFAAGVRPTPGTDEGAPTVRPARPYYVSKNATYVPTHERSGWWWMARVATAALLLLAAATLAALAFQAVDQPTVTRPTKTVTPSPYGPPGPQGGAFATMPAARDD